MAVSRFEMAGNKKTALMKQQMREISKLLDESPPKEEKARIRAEALIRDDGVVEAYEILQLTCELLGERIKLISSEKACPDDLKSSISTLVWASKFLGTFFITFTIFDFVAMNHKVRMYLIGSCF